MTDQAREGLPFLQQSNTSSSQPKTMTDVLTLPDAERKLMNWLMRRRRASLTEISDHLEESSDTAQKILKQLFQAGFITPSDDVETGEDVVFKPKIMSRR